MARDVGKDNATFLGMLAEVGEGKMTLAQLRKEFSGGKYPELDREWARQNIKFRGLG